MEGGLTREQLETLVTEFTEIRNEEMEFEAAMQGVELSGASGESKESVSTPNTSQEVKVPLFSDPATYANMSEEKKQSLTDNMRSKHKKWSSDKKA